MRKKLAFGGMHLPLLDPADPASIDFAELERMVDRFLARGFDCFDTAWTYHDGRGEAALRRALVERYPRDRFRLTDKLPTMLLESEAQQEAIFAEQLERCGVHRFDRYLVHCATAAFAARAERFRSFEFALRKRREGLTDEVGFSFHDTPELLEELLTRHPEVDFVQLQVSYLDWEHTPIRARACCETARRHGKPIVVMCPLKGGLLADLPAGAERLLRSVQPAWGPADWALRFAAGVEGVTEVLSGMGSLQQLEANIAALDPFEPLGAAERAALGRVAELVAGARPIPCTGCGYCLPTCPQGIPIPDDLRLCNAGAGADGHGFAERLAAYEAAAAGHGRASDCIACRRCETVCPQRLRIVDGLRRAAGLFEQPRPVSAH